MATATVEQQPTVEQKDSKPSWNGGSEPMKASYGKLMMWFFLLSDAFTFSAFLIAYGVSRFTSTPYIAENLTFETINGVEVETNVDGRWPIPEQVFDAIPFFHGLHAPLVFVGIMTFILILSSVTMVLAVEAGERRSRKEVEKWMFWTVIGGIAFLGCQAWEWSHFIHGTDAGAILSDGTRFYGANLINNEYGPALFADLFFFITGFHGFHVFSGVVINIIIFYNVVMGVYDRIGHYEMVEKVGLYWHFVDLVWVFVFTLFYLI